MDNIANQVGAVYADDTALEVMNCTFYENNSTLGVGGAIYVNSGDTTVVNSILWANNGNGALDDVFGTASHTLQLHTDRTLRRLERQHKRFPVILRCPKR